MARRNRIRKSVLALMIGAGACALAVTPADAAEPVPTDAQIEAKQRAIERTRSDAAHAAAAYTQAVAELARLEQQIADLEERIPALEARIAELKRLLSDRAAVLYRGGDSAGIAVLDEVSSTGDVLAGGRVARLAEAAQARTEAQKDELDASKRQIERDRDDLREARTQLGALADEANRRAQALSEAVERATADLQVAQARQSLARYLAAMEAQRQAAVAAAEEPQTQKPPADPALAANVPVANMVCPIDGVVTFSDGFGQSRSSWRVHQGTDVFASRGTPNVAVADGVVHVRHNTLGGNALWLYDWAGNSYYYAHLDAYEGTFDAEGNRVVTKGEVIGYTGNTGNAMGGPFHTHFEVHPGNVGPINPYPLLLEMCAVQAGLRPPPGP